METFDQEKYLKDKIWSKVEQLCMFDIYQDISEFIRSNILDFRFENIEDKDLENVIFYSVAPYLKRYLTQFDQIFYSHGNFLVWGRKKTEEPLFRCSILQSIVIDRLSSKMIGSLADHHQF